MSTIIKFFKEKVTTYPNNDFLWEKTHNIYQSTSYSEGYEIIKNLALGFHNFGIRSFDKVALLSEGCNYWLLSELAILCNRAITVPLSAKLAADNDLIFRINHSECKYIVVSATQMHKIRAIKHQLNNIQHIIVLNATDTAPNDEVDIQFILDLGKKIGTSSKNIFEELIAKVQEDDVATITYTSGTTSQPKGIMLTHRNYTANVEQAFSYIDIPEHYRTLVVLPWDHAFAHTASLYAFMMKGASIASVQIGKTPLETLKNFSNNINEVQPHVLMSVPALAKNFKANIIKNIAQKGAYTKALFHYSLKISYWYYGDGTKAGKGLKYFAKPLIKLFDQLIYKKIRQGFSSHLQFFIGGGALLDYDLQQFFYSIGLPMYQGYGLSEASPIISANTPQHHKLGSSGKVLNGIDIKICNEDGIEVPKYKQGEIVIRGENVMKGYWKNPEATKETIKEGWLYTGDLGYLDKDGYLYVKGRFKSLLIGADGEKYSPEAIEEAIVDHCTFIEQIMIYNNQCAYTIAIIVPNIGLVKEKRLSPEQTINEISDQLAWFKEGGKYENSFPIRWIPSCYGIAPEAFSEKNKLINSTMKMVRSNIESYFHKELDYCYQPEGKIDSNLLNIENITKLMKS